MSFRLIGRSKSSLLTVGVAIWLNCMAGLCNKCGQTQPHLSDSWCLACAAHEALGAEIKSYWGQPGSRSIATDILCSSLRQIRALRRFGVAVAASAGSTPQEGASLHPRGKTSGAEPRESGSAPVLKPAPNVKEEESQESESESSETEAAPEKRDPGEKAEEETAHRTTAAKSKAKSDRSPVPRRRHEDRGKSEDTKDERSKRSRSSGKSRERKKQHFAEEPRPSRDHWRHPESDRKKSRSRKRSKAEKKERKRFRPGHRGGSRHQKFERGLEDPYRRFHLPHPGAFWDGQHASIYPAQW